MDVYLLRHAIAERRDAARWPDDSIRPLAPEGVERFRRAARGLRRIAPTVDVVLASPYLRAWQTAELLRDEAGWPAPTRCPALEASAAVSEVVDVLRDQGGRSSVALVGHEPNLSWLASLLLAGHEHAVPLELKKGAAVLLTLSSARTPGSALLRWSASPKILRSLIVRTDR
jgi:phosphohistidine phosphatase